MSVLLIGTAAGLFEAGYDGSPFNPHLVGFDSRRDGEIRSPVLVDVDNPDRLYAGTGRSGVWRSDDYGRTWAPKNIGLIYQEVWWLEQHRTTGELYAGTGPVAIFRSNDGGEHWAEIEELRNAPGRSDWFLHLAPYFARIRTIALVPEDPNVIFAAIEEGWVIRSFDGGKSWENLRDAIGHDSHVATLVPGVPNRVLVSTHIGVFASADAGSTFRHCDDFDTSYTTQLQVHPAQPSRVYGAGAVNTPDLWRTKEGAGTRLYVSDDAGESWTRTIQGLPDFLHGGPRAAAIDPTNPDIYLVGTTDGEIWITRDGGKSAELFGDHLPGRVTALTVVG